MSSSALYARFPVWRALLTFIVMMLLTALMITPARAQQTPLPPEYNAGIAFFKYAKVRPDFNQWVKSSKRYAEATPRERINMLRLEPALLDSRFDNYIPAENPIELRMQGRIFVIGRKRAEEIIAREGQIKIPIRVTGYEDGSFPLQVGDMWITLIPTNLEEMTTLTLDKDQYNQFMKLIKGTSLSTGTEASLRITFLPTGANTKEPLRMNDFELWMLRAKILEVEVWDARNKSMAWLIEAPGHKAQHKQSDIFNLYE